MKAIVVHELGGPDRLNLADVAEPTAGEGELLVEVAAAGVNFIDTYHRGGLYPMTLPFTPGLEGSGTILSKGANVVGFERGDRVAWTGVLGSYAERLRVPSEKAVEVPDDVGLQDAAAVMLQGITAQYLATSTYPLKPGDRCLIHAGAGGVGLLLTQMAKAKGAEVITTVGTPEKAELSQAFGSDLAINYSKDDFKEAVEERFGPDSVDVVYDGVGAATFEKGLDLLRPKGMMVIFGNASGPPAPVAPLDLMRKGSLFLTRPTLADYTSTREDLVSRASDVLSQVASETLEVHIGAVYGLSDAAKAHSALEQRHTTGKLLLVPPAAG